MPRFEAGLRRVSQHGSFLPRRQDNPPKPLRFRVSNFMNKFRDLGFVSYSGSSIEVHSALLSVLLNDKPQIRRDDATDAE